ncbi:MAG: hypothetical protein IJL52_06070 [Clostridia bacterium]|nr:hypothetical protein [Clostridia bacterium]
MKRILAIVLALALILTTFAACGKKKSSTAEDTSEYEALYAPVLKKYKQAFEENWSREKFMENNLSPNLAALDKTAEPSFAFLDLNGDKTPELFIGRADQRATVYDMYTATDDHAIKQVTTPTTEETYTLTNDNRLVREDDSYEKLDVVTFYELEDDALTPKDSYIHDEEQIINGMDAWFHATGDLPASESEFYAEDMNVITEAEYIEKTAYELGKLVMKTFAELVPADDDTAQDTEPTADPFEEAKAVYNPVIEQYREALVDLHAGINSFADRGLTTTNIDFVDGTPGYTIIDINQDGVMELITGRKHDDGFVELCDLYTILDNEPKWLISSGMDLSGFFVTTSGQINKNEMYYGLSSVESYVKYEITNGELTVKNAYLQVEPGTDMEETITGYYSSNKEISYDNNGKLITTDLQPVSEAEYFQFVDAYRNDLRIDLTLTPFDAVEPDEPSTDALAQDTPVTPGNTGEYITFGSYEQDNDESNGPEPLEWLVLDRDGDKVFVVSKCGLKNKQYNKERIDITWETCELRTWLNDTFYNSAFSSTEKSKILTTTVINDDNAEYGTAGGNDTQDKVFLLSVDEANKYFSSNAERTCEVTAYASVHGTGTWTGRSASGQMISVCWWWLRSPGRYPHNVAHVGGNGDVNIDGSYIDSLNAAVRPAMWITVNA